MIVRSLSDSLLYQRYKTNFIIKNTLIKCKSDSKINYKLMKNNKSLNYYCKRLIRLLCFALMLYQTVLLTERYVKRETVIYTIIERFSETPLPAITVCFPTIIQFNNFAKTYSQFMDEYKNYSNRFWKFSDEKKLHIYWKLLIKIRNILFELNPTLIEMFDNISITLSDINRGKYIKVKYEVKNRIYKQTVISDNKPIEWMTTTQPMSKCFTYLHLKHYLTQHYFVGITEHSLSTQVICISIYIMILIF